MEQTVIKVGNSLAVTLPRHFVNAKKLKAGKKVYVESDAELDIVQVRTESKSVSSFTPEFKQWLDKVTNKYSDVIKELAKR